MVKWVTNLYMKIIFYCYTSYWEIIVLLCIKTARQRTWACCFYQPPSHRWRSRYFKAKVYFWTLHSNDSTAHVPPWYIYIFFFSEQILQQKDVFTFKSHNYLTARNREGKMAILDSNDHIIHMQTNRVYNKDVCYSRELFSCLRLTLSQGEEARVGDWGDESPWIMQRK